MWRRLLFLAILCVAAPALASEAHGGGGNPALGAVVKILNLVAFFGILIYIMARPLRGFFEKHTEGIRSSIDDSRTKEREAVDLEAQARALAATVDAEVEALRARFAADRERVKTELQTSTTKALARLRTDHERSLRQLEDSFRRDLMAHALHAAQAEAVRSLKTDLTPADRARFLETVTAGGEGA